MPRKTVRKTVTPAPPTITPIYDESAVVIDTAAPIPGTAHYSMSRRFPGKPWQPVGQYATEHEAWSVVVKVEGTENVGNFACHWRIANPAGNTCVDV